MSAAEPRVVYRPRKGATPEAELGALSTVYAFILQKRRAKQQAAPASRPDDRKEIKDVPAKAIIPAK